MNQPAVNKRKIAVVLFNLGGPDSLYNVKSYLYNLFSDPAIIRLPGFLRTLVARKLSAKREKEAQEIYRSLGGKSPLLEYTQEQAVALEEALYGKGGYKVFICMRYWNPRAQEVVKEVLAYDPDHIILLPLYPQFSSTTTASSIKEWKAECNKAKLLRSTATICCYPVEDEYITSHAWQVRDVYFKAAEFGRPRILFSAHGLPERIVKAGDPYQWQVEQTVEKLVKLLAIDGLDYVTSYQSRVGPLKWITPYTDEEIVRAAKDKAPIVVVPISFVCENSETLYELDEEYKKLAASEGWGFYFRVPALGVQYHFIELLKKLCLNATYSHTTQSSSGDRICPANFADCPCKPL